MADFVVTKTVHIAALRRAVWEALTVPELIGEWLGETAELDPRVGGLGTIGWGSRGQSNLRVVAIEEPSTFAFDWAHESIGERAFGDASTRVRFTLDPHDGGTRVTVTETGWERFGPDATDEVAGHGRFWADELAQLEAFLVRQDSV
jgi:uncharacterized protein YndB with AHSA1/START domain